MGASLSTITQQPALPRLSAQRQFQLTPLTKMLSRQSCVKLYRYIIYSYGIKGPYTKRREHQACFSWTTACDATVLRLEQTQIAENLVKGLLARMVWTMAGNYLTLIPFPTHSIIDLENNFPGPCHKHLLFIATLNWKARMKNETALRVMIIFANNPT